MADGNSGRGGGGMLVPMLFLIAGYTIGSYGWILLKGYNVPFRSWVSPLNPYQWPAKGQPIPQIPPGRVFPGKASAAGGAANGFNAPKGTKVKPGPGGRCPPGYFLVGRECVSPGPLQGM
jgi:hypothetical protein